MNIFNSDCCFKGATRRYFSPGGVTSQVANSRLAVEYTKFVTGGNDPHISKAMRYAAYIRNTKNSHPVIPYSK
jgi:hypothetical protein